MRAHRTADKERAATERSLHFSQHLQFQNLPSLLFSFSNAKEERMAAPFILILRGYNYIIRVNQTSPLCPYNRAHYLELTANGLITFSSSNIGREELKYALNHLPHQNARKARIQTAAFEPCKKRNPSTKNTEEIKHLIWHRATAKQLAGC